MKINKENYRVFEKQNMVFMNNASAQETEKFDADKVRETFEKRFFKDIDPPKTTDLDSVLKFVKNTFEQKFSPEQYETGIRALITEYVTDSNVVDRLTKDAVKRYKDSYDAAMGRFYRMVEQKIIDYESLKDSVQTATKSGLELLMNDVQKSVKAESATPALDNVPPPAEKGDRWPYKIPIVGPIFKNADIPILSRLIDSKDYRQYKEFQYQNTAKFSAFVKALNGKYLESKQHADNLTGNGKKEYEELAGRFKNGMEDFMLSQLEYIYSNSHDANTLKMNLEGLRDKLNLSYSQYDADQDKILNLYELRKLDNDTKQYIDLSRLINSTDDEEELEKKLEGLNFFNRDAWKNATDVITDQLICDATRNGSEAAFINGVKKLTKSSKDMSFDEAADKFRSIMQNRAQTGVKETIKTFREFNKEVNGGRAEILNMDDINPPSIKVLVYRQRDLILARKLVPQNIDDRIVAEFMSTNLVGRSKMLDDSVRRQALFQAVQNIKEHYPKIYNSQYKSAIPKKVSDLETRRMHPEQPTQHDEIARFLAMLTLAKETEWIINNLDKSKDYKGWKLAKDLENTEAEKVPPAMDRKFRSVETLYRTGYTSEAERAGFNGRDVAIGALKVWAGLTLVMNFMNARKQMHGTGIDPWIKGMTAMATNPYFLGGAAAVYGIDRFQKNPEARSYLFQDAGGQERIATHISLSGLSQKVGRPRVLAFINNGGEFKAMQKMFENPTRGVSTVNSLLKKARDKATKENSNEPVLTKEDLKDTLDPQEWSQLSPSGNDRVRFLFYEKMLTSPRNIRQLKGNCERWV